MARPFDIAFGFIQYFWCNYSRDRVRLKHLSLFSSVLDFAADTTGVMERKGNVYPFVKSATLGYGYGHKSDEEFDGVCSQVINSQTQ